ncbi:hypothetical protein NDI47_14360 [Microcoleus vaginatus GB1-A2]|uniref:hypothetical protein n=1 Tax=Microcoleus vaginatus TaxID=119532 RepID=UPI001689D9D7|nr:hypothetical protein [Microcoleus sp. FACHB-61]
MTQQNPRELLKHGDPNAIASSINRTLKPKGINADVTRDNGCLHITLEADKVPDQMVLVDFIRTGMTKLGLESIHTVKVYGRRTGDGSPAWEDEIDLMPAESMPYGMDSGMPDDSVGLDDVEPEGEDYYQDGEFDRDDDEEDEDEHEEQAPPPKKQFPKWIIPVGILVPLGAIAGLFLTGNFPFGGDSNPEPNPPEAASPSPKAASPASKATAPSPAASPGTPQAASPAPKVAPTAAAPASPSPTSPPPQAAPASPAPNAASPAPKAAAPKPDSWREAVNKAQRAAILAQTAQSQNEWIAVASEWQQAVKLVRAVPSTSPNYQKAQQKAQEYQANLIVANRRAAAAP